MTEDKTYASVKTAGAILEALCGAPVDGMANKDLAAAARCSPSQVSRLCPALQAVGWVRKGEDTGRFYITPAFTRLTFRVLADLNAAQQQLDDQRRNLTGA